MFRIKIKHNGKWITADKFDESDKWNALDSYNGAPTPKMLMMGGRIIHKQYSDNGFIYIGK